MRDRACAPAAPGRGRSSRLRTGPRTGQSLRVRVECSASRRVRRASEKRLACESHVPRSWIGASVPWVWPSRSFSSLSLLHNLPVNKLPPLAAEGKGRSPQPAVSCGARMQCRVRIRMGGRRVSGAGCSTSAALVVRVGGSGDSGHRPPPLRPRADWLWPRSPPRWRWGALTGLRLARSRGSSFHADVARRASNGIARS